MPTQDNLKDTKSGKTPSNPEIQQNKDLNLSTLDLNLISSQTLKKSISKINQENQHVVEILKTPPQDFNQAINNYVQNHQISELKGAETSSTLSPQLTNVSTVTPSTPVTSDHIDKNYMNGIRNIDNHQLGNIDHNGYDLTSNLGAKNFEDPSGQSSGLSENSYNPDVDQAFDIDGTIPDLGYFPFENNALDNNLFNSTETNKILYFDSNLNFNKLLDDQHFFNPIAYDQGFSANESQVSGLTSTLIGNLITGSGSSVGTADSGNHADTDGGGSRSLSVTSSDLPKSLTYTVTDTANPNGSKNIIFNSIPVSSENIAPDGLPYVTEYQAQDGTILGITSKGDIYTFGSNPQNVFSQLTSTQIGIFSFSHTVSDGVTTSNIATATITINGQSPTAYGNAYYTTPDQLVSSNSFEDLSYNNIGNVINDTNSASQTDINPDSNNFSMSSHFYYNYGNHNDPMNPTLTINGAGIPGGQINIGYYGYLGPVSIDHVEYNSIEFSNVFFSKVYDIARPLSTINASFYPLVGLSQTGDLIFSYIIGSSLTPFSWLDQGQTATFTLYYNNTTANGKSTDYAPVTYTIVGTNHPDANDFQVTVNESSISGTNPTYVANILQNDSSGVAGINFVGDHKIQVYSLANPTLTLNNVSYDLQDVTKADGLPFSSPEQSPYVGIYKVQPQPSDLAQSNTYIGIDKNGHVYVWSDGPNNLISQLTDTQSGSFTVDHVAGDGVTTSTSSATATITINGQSPEAYADQFTVHTANLTEGGVFGNILTGSNTSNNSTTDTDPDAKNDDHSLQVNLLNNSFSVTESSSLVGSDAGKSLIYNLAIDKTGNLFFINLLSPSESTTKLHIGDLDVGESATFTFDYSDVNSLGKTSNTVTDTITVYGDNTPVANNDTFKVQDTQLMSATSTSPVNLGNIITGQSSISSTSDDTGADTDGRATPGLRTLNLESIDPHSAMLTITGQSPVLLTPIQPIAGSSFVYEFQIPSPSSESPSYLGIDSHGNIYTWSTGASNVFSNLTNTQTATITFNDTITDSVVGSNSATTTLIVQGSDSSITAVDDTYFAPATTIDKTVTTTTGFDIGNALSNDADSKNLSLQISDVTTAPVLKVNGQQVATFESIPVTSSDYRAEYQHNYGQGTVTLIIQKNGEFIFKSTNDDISQAFGNNTAQIVTTIQVTDSSGHSASENVTFNITNPNIVLNDDTFSAKASMVETHPDLGNILTNDTDTTNGATLSVTGIPFLTATINGHQATVTQVMGPLMNPSDVAEYTISDNGKTATLEVNSNGGVSIVDTSDLLESINYDQSLIINGKYDAKDNQGSLSQESANFILNIGGSIQVTSTVQGTLTTSPYVFQSPETETQLKAGLSKSHAINPSLIDGQGLIDFVNGGVLKVAQSDYSAGYRSSLGYFSVDSSGIIKDVQFISGFTNLSQTRIGASTDINIAPNTQVGFFLLPNGSGTSGNLSNYLTEVQKGHGHFELLNTTMNTAAHLSDTQAPQLFYVPYNLDGTDNLAGKIGIHSAYMGSGVNAGGYVWNSVASNLNVDKVVHFASGVNSSNPSQEYVTVEDSLNGNLDQGNTSNPAGGDYHDEGYRVQVTLNPTAVPDHTHIDINIPTSPTTNFDSITIGLATGHFAAGDTWAIDGSIPSNISTTIQGDSVILTAKNGSSAPASDFNTALHNLTLNFAEDGTTPIGGDRQVTLDIRDSSGSHHVSTETIAVGPVATDESLTTSIGNTTMGNLMLGNLLTAHNSTGTLFSDSDFNIIADNPGNVLQVTGVSSQGSINVNGNSFVMTDITSTLHNPTIQEAFNFSYQGATFELDVYKNGDVKLQNPQDLKLMNNQIAQVDLFYHIENLSTGEISQQATAAISVHG